MLRWYQMKLARRPLLTQSVTTSFLFATGDTLAQQFVEGAGPDKHDYARTGRMGLYGGVVFGPLATMWFSFLSRRVTFPRYPALTIPARVAADQLLFAPAHLLVFLSSMAWMEGVSASRKIRETYTTALTRGWMVWPGVQVANFALVPLEHRVLVVNVVSLGWNCYLSYLNNRGGKSTAPIPQKVE